VSKDQQSVLDEGYYLAVKETEDKDLSDLNNELENVITLVISRNRHMRDQNIQCSDPMLSALLDRLEIAQRNRNNLAHMLESIAWYEEYTRNR